METPESNQQAPDLASTNPAENTPVTDAANASNTEVAPAEVIEKAVKKQRKASAPVDDEVEETKAFKPSLDFFTDADLEFEIARRKDEAYNKAENIRNHGG